MSRYFTLINYWFRATFPALLVVGFGVGIFRKAVIDSIQSTPHPELVYLIFFGFFAALFFAWFALYKFIREESALIRWQEQDYSARADWLRRLHWVPALTPVYDLLSGKSKLPVRMRQSAVESEVDEFEQSLFDRLTLPGYIGGALIGLGLVGTFIGLLGTLRDLSALFSALTGDQGGQALTQAEMFKDMITRMQAPMRGMGTAFVASLYGLLGSLIVGLVIMNVRKIATLLVHRVNKSVRDYDYGAGSHVMVMLEADVDQAWAESERWNAMYTEMRERNESLIALVFRMQEETSGVLKAAKELNDTMRERNALDSALAHAIASGGEALAKGNEHYEAILRSAADISGDIQNMVQATHRINETLQERNRIDAMVERALGEGLHWMNAWDEISTEMRRVRSLIENGVIHAQALQGEQSTQLTYLLECSVRQEAALNSLVHQTGQQARNANADQKALVHALETCRESFADASSKLRFQLNLTADRAAPHV